MVAFKKTGTVKTFEAMVRAGMALTKVTVTADNTYTARKQLEGIYGANNAKTVRQIRRKWLTTAAKSAIPLT